MNVINNLIFIWQFSSIRYNLLYRNFTLNFTKKIYNIEIHISLLFPKKKKGYLFLTCKLLSYIYLFKKGKYKHIIFIFDNERN